MEYDIGSDSWDACDAQQIKLQRRRFSKWEKGTRHGSSCKRFNRNSALCSFCMRRKSTTVDHIIPRGFEGGKDRNDPMNMAPACYRCNNSKGSKHFLFFFARMQGITI